MAPSLPQQGSLDHLKKQAKQLLAAQRRGDPRCCPLLRRLHRFADASDEELLAARVSLQEVQHVIANHYGFASWEELRTDLQVPATVTEHTLAAVVESCPQELPDYAGAGVPLAVTAALQHAGVDIDYVAFTAMSGWAFSFGYDYKDISPAFLAVRGDPEADGPLEMFAAVPQWLGFGYELARTADADALWAFVQKHVDAGSPIMSEHMDGGLITGYRDAGGRRQVYFDGTVMPGWTDAGGLNPYAVYVLVRKRSALPADEIARLALRRAMRKGAGHEWKGVPQGMAALRAYLADVVDVTRDFAQTPEWFCWAAFERLMARRCAAMWLREVGERLGSVEPLLTAAGHYQRAFEAYDAYRRELSAQGAEAECTAKRIATMGPLLARGISAEADGLADLDAAVRST